MLLIGVVALNVSLLKLNRVAGRHAETAKTLHIKNTQLRSVVSRLGSSERLQREGRRLGLVMPAASEIRYLSARKGDGRRAVQELQTELQAPPGSYKEVASVRDTPVAAPQSETPPVQTAPAATAPTGAGTPPATAPTQPPPDAAPTTGTTPAPPAGQPAGGGTSAGGAQAGAGTAGGAGG